MSITFAPFDAINAGMEYLECIEPLNYVRQQEIEELFQYFESTWISGRFRLELWNCFYNFPVEQQIISKAGIESRKEWESKIEAPKYLFSVGHSKNEERFTKTRIKLIKNGHRTPLAAKKYRDINR